MPSRSTRDAGGAAWQRIAVPGFVGMQVRRLGTHVQDRVDVRDVGPVRVITTCNSPGEALRTDRDIRADDPERYAVFVQAEGVSTGEQAGRHARFERGDLGVVDLSLPLRCAFSARRAVMVTYPKQLSALRASELTPFCGARMAARTGTAGLVAELVQRLPEHLDGDGADDGAGGARLGSAVLDLINVALAAEVDRVRAVPPEARRRSLLLSCRAFIEEHLHDVELSPRAVAAAHHISVRQLHRLFEPTADGVAELIRRRRLERCRRDLLDPDRAHRPVAAIGASWGLVDAGHFSRAFKREYGVPPAEYRARFATSPTGDPPRPRAPGTPPPG
jgi:AraC-like DNA-binding protein